MSKKIIYADGSSLGNPGAGGWAFLVIDVDRKLIWEFAGHVDKATNNQMELRALTEALTQLSNSKFVGEVEIRLDSEYVRKGVTEWSKSWVKNGWQTAAKKEVLNKEYWQVILQLVESLKSAGFNFTWTHVYGHSGEVWNERVDTLAQGNARGEEMLLKSGESISI